MLLLFPTKIAPPPYTQVSSCTWVVYDHRPVLDCKDTKYFLYLCTFVQKTKILVQKFGIIKNTSYLCSVKMYVLAIQVSFLRGQAVYVTTRFKAAHQVRFYFSVIYYFRKLFIIIFRKPLLLAILRLIEISLLPENIKTSTALGDISKWCLISSVILRIP